MVRVRNVTQHLVLRLGNARMWSDTMHCKVIVGLGWVSLLVCYDRRMHQIQIVLGHWSGMCMCAALFLTRLTSGPSSDCSEGRFRAYRIEYNETV